MAEGGHWERKAKLRCETEAIKLNKEERTLMDEGLSANTARDPSEEVPADADYENPKIIMKVEVPVNEGPGAPASPAQPEVDTLAGMYQGALCHRAQQLFQRY